MSRLRRLKERKRKNRIKATSCGLALALVIGSAQGLGTYALFTDTEDISSNLAISTGDVDVEIEGNGFDITHYTNEKDDDHCTDHDITGLSIVNKGTLNQNLKIGISNIDGINKEVAEKIEFDLEFCYCGENEDNCKCNLKSKDDVKLSDLMNNKFNILNKDDSLFVLNPGQKLDIKGEIEIEGKLDTDIVEKMKEIKVELNVYASQININGNISNYGFCDKASKWNTIKVVKNEVITIATGKNAHYTGKHGNYFNKLYIPVNVNTNEMKDKIIELSAIAQESSQPIKYDASYYKDKDMHYILIQDKNGIQFKGNVNITINVVIKDKSGKIIDSYQLKCNVNLSNAGNTCGGVGEGHPSDGEKHCHTTLVNPNHTTVIDLFEEYDKHQSQELEIQDIVESSNEDLLEPTEPEVVEPPKEEIEQPSKPEVVEPPKEEITEAQKQPEVIEPPKETEGIQE